MAAVSLTAFIVVGSVFAIIWFLVTINNRDRKKDTGK